jgi:hypothetical protein
MLTEKTEPNRSPYMCTISEPTQESEE